jgi:subtilisin family serine protease
MVAIPSSLVEFILLGPLDDRRQLQDSPILGDVWVWFGNNPGKRADLLISPHRDHHAGDVAHQLAMAIVPKLREENEPESAPDIAYLQGLIAARLTFNEIATLVVPRTKWWENKWPGEDTDEEGDKGHEFAEYKTETVQEMLEKVLESAKQWFAKSDITHSQEMPAMHRFIALTGLLLWADADEKKRQERAAKAAPTTETAPPVVTDSTQPPETTPDTPETESSETAPETPADEGATPSSQSPASPESPDTKTPEPIAEAAKESEPERAKEHAPHPLDKESLTSTNDQIKYILKEARASDIAPLVIKAGKEMLDVGKTEGLVWQVSLNRPAMPAVTRSVPAVKADAAHTLFKVDASQIAWAVIDSGIDGSHPAFGKRVKKSYDFKYFRKIVSLNNLNTALRRKTLKELQDDPTWKACTTKMSDEDADKALKRLAEDAAEKGPIHWELVEKFVEIDPKTLPRSNHGTHVAGIIGASKQEALTHAEEETTKQLQQKLQNQANGTTREVDKDAVQKKVAKISGDFGDGVCPDIRLYDFRVLGNEIKDWEFAIIACLQFIRYLNDRHNFITIHGANLSLSIPHDVRNFACGRTPICNECERLIESGVVVVAAAGNHGYKSFETKDGSYDGYAAFSITDPGNADAVITVGATHRYWPHTYGVSFFSSRGPTGDGRLKPDLVAPGERIHAPFPRTKDTDQHKPGGEWGELDGTSMAAPHVSGAAAMLMARYSEFIGQPRRIKRILCDNATDLGRERSFQGHGMLDVLRSFQSI